MQHMRQPARKGALDGGAVRRPALEGGDGCGRTGSFRSARSSARRRSRQGLRHGHEPETVQFDARRRIDALDMKRLEALCEATKIVLEGAERQVLMPLARTLADRAPDVRIAFGCERQAGAALADLEPELVVKRSSRRPGSGRRNGNGRANARQARRACGWASRNPDWRSCVSSFFRRRFHCPGLPRDGRPGFPPSRIGPKSPR